MDEIKKVYSESVDKLKFGKERKFSPLINKAPDWIDIRPGVFNLLFFFTCGVPSDK